MVKKVNYALFLYTAFFALEDDSKFLNAGF